VFLSELRRNTCTTALPYTKTIVYGTFNGLNEFSVVAVDTAGNRSAPATITLSLDGCAS
jgi:hypothetical protein